VIDLNKFVEVSVAVAKHSHLVSVFRSEIVTIKNLVEDIIERSDSPRHKNSAQMTLRQVDSFFETLIDIIEGMEARIGALEQK
jgi:arginine deiminase